MSEVQTQQLLSLKEQICSLSDPTQLSEAVVAIRKLTSVEHNPPLQEIINVGLIEILVSLGYTWKDNSDVFTNILWILTNVCSGDASQTKFCVSNGVIDLFLVGCASVETTVVTQSFWGLGNIAGDNVTYRDMLLRKGCVDIIVKTLENNNLRGNDKATAIWVLSNLARGKPLVVYQYAKGMIQYVVGSIVAGQDGLEDALWSITYLSENEESHEELLRYDICKRLKDVNQEDFKLLIPSIRIFGNLTTGTDQTMDSLIKENMIDWAVSKFSWTAKQAAKKELLWSLSNVAAGNNQQKMHLLGLPNFLKLVMEMFSQPIQASYTDLYREFNYIIGNFTSSKQACQKLIQADFHKQWIEWFERIIKSRLIALDDQKIILIYIEGLKQIHQSHPSEMAQFSGIISSQLTHFSPQILVHSQTQQLKAYLRDTSNTANVEEESTAKHDLEEEESTPVDSVMVGITQSVQLLNLGESKASEMEEEQKQGFEED